MIYTVTFNPSLDYTVHMPVFRAGAINRVVQEAVYPGGKGINGGIILTGSNMSGKTTFMRMEVQLKC